MTDRTATGPWVLASALVALLAATWSLAVPLMASPDEPSHVIRAAAVARGQWGGELGPEPTGPGRPGAATMVQVPADYRDAAALPNCFAFRPDQPASCQPAVPQASDGLVDAETFAGQYPPLYYALVGWPSLVLDAEAGIYAMRLVSAVLTAALVGWSAYRLHRELGPVALWGLVVAVTPMVLFLGGTVNPQALEIASALCFWSATLAVALRRDGPSTGALVQAAVNGAVLVNTRTSSPFWAVVVVAVALLAARPGRAREIVRHRAARWVGLVAASSTLTAVAWVVTHPAQVTGARLFPQYADPTVLLLATTGSGWAYLTNMVGDFGWLDAPAPPATVTAWLLVLGAVVLPALAASAPRRARTALLALVAVVAVAPAAFQLPTAVDAGLVWQGRYALPVAVGVPLLAAAVLAVSLRPESGGPLATVPAGDGTRMHALATGTTGGALHSLFLGMARATTVVVLAGHALAFYWGTRRYSEGLAGQTLTLAPDWSSPIGFLPSVAAYTTVAAVLAVLVARALRPTVTDRTGTEPVPDAPVPVP